MATYDHKQVLADYAAGRITPEMAVGHSLQHIAQRYEAQTATRAALDGQFKLPANSEKRHQALGPSIQRLMALLTVRGGF